MNTSVLKISQLEDYLTSEIYKNSDVLPVSPERVASYSQNPRASDDMEVLFMLHEDDNIIAYRTLLPDRYFIDGESKPFAWLSGNYVRPEFRRKGLSSKLFKLVEKHWDGRLMYTNYAPASKAVYDKSGSFALFTEKQGLRYYMRSSMASLSKERFKYPGLLAFADRFINAIHDQSISHASVNIPPGVEIKEISELDHKTGPLIDKGLSDSFFRRGSREFSWIVKYPWLRTGEAEDKQERYHFSWLANQFENKWYQLNHGEHFGFLWITLVNDKVAVPYFLGKDPLLIVGARQLVLNTMLEHKASFLTIRHPDLGPVLGTRKNPFLLKREMPQRYFCHRSLLDDLPENPLIMDGDGDCVFT